MSNYLTVPSGGGASTPHQVGLVPGTNKVDLRLRLTVTQWATGSAQMLIGEYDWGSPEDRYFLYIDGTGLLVGNWINAAGAQQSANASGTAAALGWADGDPPRWVRCVMDATLGTMDFYWSTDGSSWTAIGSSTGLTTTGFNVSLTPPILAIGQTSAFGGLPLVGKIYNTVVIVGASTVINMDWTTAALGSGTWVATTGETWTRFGTSQVVLDPASVARRNVAGWTTRSGGR